MFRRLTRYTNRLWYGLLIYVGVFQCAQCGALKQKQSLYWYGHPYPTKICRPCYRRNLKLPDLPR